MSFTNPALLLVAVLLCLACSFLLRWVQGRKSAQTLAYTNLAFLDAAVAAPVWPGRVLVGALLLSVALLGSALAGPHLTARVPAKDGSVVLCIDTSGSMTSQDVAPTRAEAAKAAARTFISELPAGTKVGVVTFSTAAQLIQPLTPDHQAALDALARIPEPNGATAIGDALALAAQQLPNTGHRAVVLVTDGVNNNGVDPLEVAKFLATKHVPVYTIGIGTNDSGQLIPGTNEAATIDEDALRALADAGGGAYVKAADAQQLKSALAQLGRTTILEKKKIDAAMPFAFAGGLLLIITLFGGMAMGRIP
ncbi:MAG: VWA domain-containing protein [Candidatus Eremiobacteraeota bacterium]|nr:VWA domain-containing protein [Candidatus Eremiobacteraeota bacterium]